MMVLRLAPLGLMWDSFWSELTDVAEYCDSFSRQLSENSPPTGLHTAPRRGSAVAVLDEDDAISNGRSSAVIGVPAGAVVPHKKPVDGLLHAQQVTALLNSIALEISVGGAQVCCPLADKFHMRAFTSSLSSGTIVCPLVKSY